MRGAPLYSFGALALLIGGCAKAPEAAPEDLQALATFLFGHFEDEETEALEDGWRNLAAYLNTVDLDQEPDERAFALSPLREADLGGLGVPPGVSVEDQVPVGVVGASGFPLADQLRLATDATQTCLEASITVWAGRTFLTDPSCFANRRCDRVETLTEVRREFSIFINVWYDQYKTYRWFEVPDDNGGAFQVMAGRAWIEERFEGDSGRTSVDQLYHLDVYVADGERTLRWFGMWSSVSGLVLGEDGYANLVIDGLDEALRYGDEVLGDVSEPTCPHDRSSPKPDR